MSIWREVEVKRCEFALQKKEKITASNKIIPDGSTALDSIFKPLCEFFPRMALLLLSRFLSTLALLFHKII
jgi:hypothetical protein